MKFGTQSRSSLLIISMIFEIADLDPKLNTSADLVSKFAQNTEICSDFYEIWHSQQIEHAYYEYNSRQCPERSHHYRLRTWNYNTNYYSSYYK